MAKSRGIPKEKIGDLSIKRAITSIKKRRSLLIVNTIPLVNEKMDAYFVMYLLGALLILNNEKLIIPTYTRSMPKPVSKPINAPLK